MNQKVKSVGIDISKKTFDVCFLSADLHTIAQAKYPSSTPGIHKLIKKCHDLHVSSTTPFILESTADYHLLPALVLTENKFDVKLINPLITKQYARSTIRKQKTDPLDACLLAKIGILHDQPLPSFTSSRMDISLKKKLAALHTFEKKQQAMRSTLRKMKETFQVLDITDSPSIEALENALQGISEAIDMLKQEITKQVCQSKDVKKIAAINGISEQSAAFLVTYLAGKHFSSKSCLVAFAGLDLSVKESGSSVHGTRKLSKRGDPGLRGLLYRIAWGLMMHDQQFKALYQYYLAQGKHYYAVLTILARKFLKVLFGMLKNNTPYDPSLVRIPS